MLYSIKSLCLALLVFTVISKTGAAQNTEASLSVTLEQSNLAYFFTDEGLVVIELAEFMAPKHVERFKALINDGYYDGLDFYRVIDGFVAQGGDLSEQKPTEFGATLSAEFSRPIAETSSFISVQKPEFLAQETGFINGFPAGRDYTANIEWLLHCPGAVAMARSEGKDSATNHFYAVIGHAPRHLDRNMSVFGQVVYGMSSLQSMKRGKPDQGGVIDTPENRSKIVRAVMGDKVKADQQLTFVRNSDSSEKFQNRLKNARELSNPFYHFKGSGNIDVCYYRPRTTVAG
ncbi:peptidylprolyl isomerase [Glaciecola sp. 1036]|uniref:peptidylprolyl isomerase n=1 Tax=Alteromonadaceae TaxID=72275 RepID=UPI003CFC7689